MEMSIDLHEQQPPAKTRLVSKMDLEGVCLLYSSPGRYSLVYTLFRGQAPPPFKLGEEALSYSSFPLNAPLGAPVSACLP